MIWNLGDLGWLTSAKRREWGNWEWDDCENSYGSFFHSLVLAPVRWKLKNVERTENQPWSDFWLWKIVQIYGVFTVFTHNCGQFLCVFHVVLQGVGEVPWHAFFFGGWAEASRKRNVTLQEMELSNSPQGNRVKETWISALRGSYSTDGFISGVHCGDLKHHQSVGCAAGMMCIAAPGGTRKPRMQVKWKSPCVWMLGSLVMGVHFTSILLFLIVCVFSGWGGQCGKHPDIQAKFIL